MLRWQYAQLTITVTGRASQEDNRKVLWQEPGRRASEEYSNTNQTIPELLNRFGADGWELVGLQEHCQGEIGASYWDSFWSTTTYTFKRPVQS